MNIIIIRRVINIIRDILFSYIYTNQLKDKKNLPISKKILSLLFLGAIILLYPAEDSSIFSNAFIRLIYRALCFYGYLITRKEVSKEIALYDAFLIDILLTITHNLFLTPLTRPILLGTMIIVPHYFTNQFLCLFWVNLLTLLIYFIVYSYIKLTYITNVYKIRFILLSLISIISLYLNDTLRMITDASLPQTNDFSIFALLLQTTLLVCIILFEIFQHNQKEKIDYQLQTISGKALLKSIQNENKNNEKIKSLKHDLKNHLISLQYLMNTDQDKAKYYLNELIGDYTNNNVLIKTGHPLLDGLITSKINPSIHISILADFTRLSFISDMDLCILFGNLIDNAIEACQDVDDSYIDIKGGLKGEQFIYKITNSHCHIIDSSLKTTKKDASIHGIGLKNVKNVIDKYHGMIHYQYDSNIFTTIIIIPSP